MPSSKEMREKWQAIVDTGGAVRPWRCFPQQGDRREFWAYFDAAMQALPALLGDVELAETRAIAAEKRAREAEGLLRDIVTDIPVDAPLWPRIRACLKEKL